jgi:hypothetical protein
LRLQDLPWPAWDAILPQLALADLLALRLAAKELLPLVIGCIAALATSPDGSLPAGAWAAFPQATSLAVRPQSVREAELERVCAAVATTLASAPSARLQSLVVDVCGVGLGLRGSMQLAGQAADGLLAKYSTLQPGGGDMALQRLCMGPLSTQKADQLCSCVSSLQELQLTVRAAQPSVPHYCWRPQLQLPRLQKMMLSSWCLQLDLGPLLASCSSSLQELEITRGYVFAGEVIPLADSPIVFHNIGALAALTQLQALRLLASAEANTGWWPVLGGMTQLQELRAGFLECSAQRWQQLAAWPGLSKLHLGRLDLGMDARPCILQADGLA